jgi:hypothetical protein
MSSTLRTFSCLLPYEAGLGIWVILAVAVWPIYLHVMRCNIQQESQRCDMPRGLLSAAMRCFDRGGGYPSCKPGSECIEAAH